MGFLHALLLLAATVFITRQNAVYDSVFLFQRHITIKNNILKKLLIPDKSILNNTTTIKNKHPDNLTVIALILYLISLILFIILICCLLFNAEKIADLSSFYALALCFSVFIETLNESRYTINKAKRKKLSKALLICFLSFLGIFMCAIFIASIIQVF